MTMAIDNQQRHPMGASMGYDQMHYPNPTPQFNNPWTSGPSQGGFAAPTSNMNYDYKPAAQKPTSADHWRLKPNYARYGSRLFCSDADSRQQVSFAS